MKFIMRRMIIRSYVKVIIYIDGMKFVRYFMTEDTSELNLRNAGENICADVMADLGNLSFTKISTTVTEIDMGVF